jgi:hypothetical protein
MDRIEALFMAFSLKSRKKVKGERIKDKGKGEELQL